MTKPKQLAFWNSRGGKYWLELLQHADGDFSFRHDHGGGYIGQRDPWDRMAEELESYAYDDITMIRR